MKETDEVAHGAGCCADLCFERQRHCQGLRVAQDMHCAR